MKADLGNRKKTIAVFDDDRDLLEIYAFLFEEEGYRVVLYQDCKEVVSKMRELLPDVILMDNWIPAKGGVEAIAELKRETDLLHIPIILVSANNDVVQIADRAGADGAVAKPFEFEELLGVIAKLAT